MGVRPLFLVAGAALARRVAAQKRQGPLPPPPPSTVAPSAAPAEAAKTNAPRQEASSHITNEPTALPVQQVIQKFKEHEEEFRKERNNFTYTQIFVFQEIDEDSPTDRTNGLTIDNLFTPTAS